MNKVKEVLDLLVESLPFLAGEAVYFTSRGDITTITVRLPEGVETVCLMEEDWGLPPEDIVDKVIEEIKAPPPVQIVYYYELGSVVKRIREGQGYTQGDLAELVHISASTLSAYENDHRQLPITLAQNIALVLGYELTLALTKKKHVL